MLVSNLQIKAARTLSAYHGGRVINGRECIKEIKIPSID